MTLFTKEPEECETESDRLFYIFRNGGGFDRIPEWIEESGGVSRRLAEACEVAAFSKEKKLKYEFEKMNEWDIEAQREYAVCEGRKEGRKEGLAEGEAKAKTDMARAMLQENMPIGQIARITGLSEDQIRVL